MKKYAVIVAGGTGSRMKSSIPKQFLLLQGKPVLMHTLSVFFQWDSEIELVLVLPQDHIDSWNSLVEHHDFRLRHRIVAGGETRTLSVFNGLKECKSEGLVAIHDGARPLVTAQVIERTFAAAGETGSGVAAVPVKDSIRYVEGDSSYSKDRSHYYLVQTPQTFQLDIIKSAFDKTEPTDTFTDDASVYEYYGGQVKLVEGDYDNLKITTPGDLALAEAILAHRK